MIEIKFITLSQENFNSKARHGKASPGLLNRYFENRDKALYYKDFEYIRT